MTSRGLRCALAGIVAAAALAAALPASAAGGAAAATVSPRRAPQARGYWLVASDGGVFSYGSAGYYGSTGGVRLANPVVGMAVTASGAGYWLAAADGGVFAFGDAAFLGSTGSLKLNSPIVGVAASPAGAGYWLAAADGGIFSFGAPFLGSAGSLRLAAPVVGIAPTPSGRGYWLVASDGGVFSYGDAAFWGSTGGIRLNRPIVGIAPTPSGRGYWLVASDGGVFSYGDAAFWGSTGGIRLNRPVVSVAGTPGGQGYWLAASDGGIFGFGDASFHGSTGGLRLASPVVGVAALPDRAPGRAAVFYYPWYASLPRDGIWRHWESNYHQPPDDIGAAHYPLRGPYSSADAGVTGAHMAEIAAAGIDEVIVSWWGRGSFEDRRLPEVLSAARAHGVEPAAHVEPYLGRSAATMAADLAYLRGLGISRFYVYLATRISAAEWAGVTAGPGAEVTILAHGGASAVRSGSLAAFAEAAGFDGIYTYDPLVFQGSDFGQICAGARARLLLCAPSVAPGYDAVRGTGDPRVRPRERGITYDLMWEGALAAGAEIVTVTSHNEWNEGTQIEPAAAKCLPGGFCYETYEGAYGRTGDAAPGAYLERTAFWTARYRELMGSAAGR